MNATLKRIRQISGIFFEVMFLLFVVAYFWAHAHHGTGRNDTSLSYKAGSAKEITLRQASATSMLAQNFDHLPSFHWEFTEHAIDLASIEVSLSKALLFVNTFSRNIFYALTFINAP